MDKKLAGVNEVTIARPVEEVFAFFANPENDPQWRCGVVKMEHASGAGVGARYRQLVKGPGGRSIEADIEIIALDPSDRIEFVTIKGPVRPRGRYQLTDSDGGTRVRFELEAELTGLKRLVMAPMVRKTMSSEVGQLTRAKELLERGEQ